MLTVKRERVRVVVMLKGRHTWCGGRRRKGNDDGCYNSSLTDASITSLGCGEGIGLTQKVISTDASTILFLFHSAYVLRMKKPG